MGAGKVIGIGCAVVFGLALIGSASNKSSSQAEGSAASPPPDRGESSESASTQARASAPEAPAQPKIDLQVDAAKLWQDYDANEVAADNQYKGKMLLVTGTVSSIDKDFLDNIVIRLSSPNQFMDVMATLDDSETATAAALSKGQSVTVLCEGGGMIIGSPILRDCKMQ